MINLIKGDCLEVMKTIESGSIDAIITDPPYGTTACKWDSVIDFELMWEQLKRIIKPNGAIVLFGSEPFSSALRMSNIKNYKYDWYWNKVNSGNFATAKYNPLKSIEIISVFSTGKKINYYPIMTDADESKNRPIVEVVKKLDATQGMGSGVFKEAKDRNRSKRYPKNILKYNNRENELNMLKRVHPTQKPVALMEYLIKTYTNENETVLDFTMGSGSTGVAAKNLNRHFIGIEQDENYFNIATNRINDATI